MKGERKNVAVLEKVGGKKKVYETKTQSERKGGGEKARATEADWESEREREEKS